MVCALQAFTALKSEFDNKGVTLVGASKDAKEPQAAFAEKFNVPSAGPALGVQNGTECTQWRRKVR